MDKAASSGKKSRTWRVLIGTSLQSVYLSSEESVSDTSVDASSVEEYVDKHIAPSQEFLEILASAVSNYMGGCISSCRCALCPFREFPRPCRVRLHVENTIADAINGARLGGNS